MPPPRDRASEFVDVALGIVDAEGLDALTMRRLAAGAGVSPMALYYYFADKQAVLRAIAGRLEAEMTVGAVTGAESAELTTAQWVEELTMRAVRVLLRHHPDLTVLLQTEVTGATADGLTEQAFGNYDEMLRRLAAIGVTGATALRLSYLSSQTVFMLAFACRKDPDGDDADTRLQLQWQGLRAVSQGRYPHTESAVDEALSGGGDDGGGVLEYGVRMLGDTIRRLEAEAERGASDDRAPGN